MTRDMSENGSSASNKKKSFSAKAGSGFSVVGDGSHAFATLTQRAGFDCYAIIDISHLQNGRIRPVILQNDLHTDMLQAFLAAGDLLGECSLFDRLIQSDSPFSWQTGYNAVSGEKNILGAAPIEDQFDAILETFNIYFGRCVPVSSPSNRNYVVVFMGAQKVAKNRLQVLDRDTARNLAQLFSSANDIGGQINVNLSTIEQNCFQLLAEGYTPSQIAQTKNISDQTLQLLFGNVCKKLSTSTLAHALLLLYISNNISA